MKTEKIVQTQTGGRTDDDVFPAGSSMAAPPRLSLAWQNINKTLPLRGILFDARAILRAPGEANSPEVDGRTKGLAAAGLGHTQLELRRPEQLLADGKIDDMLQSELREELKRRELNPVGKAWELRARLTAALEAELVGIRAPTGTRASNLAKPLPAAAASANHLATLPGGSAASASEKRAAYAAKLRLRAGASLLSDGQIAPLTGQRASLPDNIRPPSDTAGSWHLQPGVRELLAYLDMRNIRRALLPADVESEEAVAKQEATISRALQLPAFMQVLSLDEAKACRQGDAAPLQSLHKALDLSSTSELLVVTDDATVLRTAKQARSFTCYFVKRLPGAPKSLPADFRADDCMAVRHAVEDLCGVTFRDTDTEIRSQYGVYQT